MQDSNLPDTRCQGRGRARCGLRLFPFGLLLTLLCLGHPESMNRTSAFP
jgi:hypothetical protein